MSETDLTLRVLLVDDDKNIRQTLSVGLRSLNCDVETAESSDRAMQMLRSAPVDLVLTDFKMEGKTGLDLVRFTKTLQSVPVTVLMTAFASFENAVDVIKEGAFDYLAKPFSRAQLSHVLSKVRTLVELKRENDRLKKGSFRSDYFSGMISPAMTRLEDFVAKVASQDVTVLMVGESGTGKTELARVIHERSNRSKHPFVVISCTSLAETLLESELFGHVRGSFTGAAHDHIGKFELANHGTVFLDEVGDLSLGGQAKLLRVLQERVIERVGSNRSVAVDARIIAATNKNLVELVREGKFREDLYYRLNIFECEVVPLRYRKEDLPVLIAKFAREFMGRAPEPQMRLIPDAVMELLLSYSWPGNIRELRNALERAILLSSGRQLSLEDLPRSMRSSGSLLNSLDTRVELRTLEDLEREHIQKILAVTENQEQAASILGITTVTLWRKRKQYGLP